MFKLLIACSLIVAVTFQGMAQANYLQVDGINKALVQWCSEFNNSLDELTVKAFCKIVNEDPDNIIVYQTQYDNVLKVKVNYVTYFFNIKPEIISDINTYTQNYLKEHEMAIL